MKMQKLLFQVSSILPDDLSFEVMQQLYASHGQKLTETTTREWRMIQLVDCNQPIIPENENESHFYSLPGEDSSGNAKSVYLHLLIDELRGGRLVSPLHYASTFLHYLDVHTWSNDRTRCGNFLIKDLTSAVKIGLMVNAKNVHLNSILKARQKCSMGWFNQVFRDMYDTVSPKIIFYLLETRVKLIIYLVETGSLSDVTRECQAHSNGKRCPNLFCCDCGIQRDLFSKKRLLQGQSSTGLFSQKSVLLV